MYDLFCRNTECPGPSGHTDIYNLALTSCPISDLNHFIQSKQKRVLFYSPVKGWNFF